MVPNLSKGAGIKGTALYVLHDVRNEGERALGDELTPDRQTQHRIGMTATRNLSTDDPELAWRLMCATAMNRDALKEAAGVHKGGRPSKYQCGHLSLSWEHETRPDRAEMLKAAEGALTALGWEKCQALIVEHRDHDHSHCHIVVNLIDPETGRTARNVKNDYETVQRWAHEYDKARGIEACPNRAERMERAPDEPTPPQPQQRWLSRKEYEALRDSERAEHKAAALDRYRTAAADVREQFRPEWSSLYQQQRAELRAIDKEQAGTMRALERACGLRHKRQSDHERSAARVSSVDGNGIPRTSGLADFYNQHRETVWRGLEGQPKPGDNRTLLTPAFLKAAIERAHAADREALLGGHQDAKAELQARHTEARQEAYRAAWQRPTPASVVPAPEPVQEPSQAKPEPVARRTGLAATLAASAAGIAAYAIMRGRNRDGASDPQRDPQRDLDQAAERIARQQPRPANSNRQERATEAPKQPEEPARGGSGGGDGEAAKPARSELDELRAKVEATREAMRKERAEAAAARRMERGFDRERSRD